LLWLLVFKLLRSKLELKFTLELLLRLGLEQVLGLQPMTVGPLELMPIPGLQEQLRPQLTEAQPLQPITPALLAPQLQEQQQAQQVLQPTLAVRLALRQLPKPNQLVWQSLPLGLRPEAIRLRLLSLPRLPFHPIQPKVFAITPHSSSLRFAHWTTGAERPRRD